MFQDIVIRVKTRQFQMYNEYFSFFHSNSINKILTSKKIDQVILYRDLQFFDDETQYLKRAYYQTEAYNRIKKLISYYEKNMTPPSPILLTVEQYQYLDNRNRKILKLCIMKEKSQAQGQKQKKKSFMQSNGLKVSNMSAIADILPKLEQSNLQNIADSDRDQSQEQSYDSDVHDVFQDFKQKARHLFSDGADNPPQYKQVLTIRNVKESQLVINFKTANEPPSDFNNCENQPKIIVSEPPNIVGLKFNNNKPLKQQENNVLQQQSYQSYQNQALQSQGQSNTYPQQQTNTNFQQGYQGSAVANPNNQPGSNNMYQQPQVQSVQNSIQYQNPSQQPLKPSIIDNQGQFSSGNNNNFSPVENNSSVKKIANQLNYVQQSNTQNYQSQQQSSTAGSSSDKPNTFSKMLNNYNSNGGSYSNQGNAPISNNAINGSNPNTINNATSPNKKPKPSFMQYYHSVPTKNPTNILQKYMKRKK